MSLRSRTGLKHFEQEFSEQERQKELERTAPIRAMAQRSAELQAQVNEAELNLLLSQPSADLTARCPQFDPTTETITSAEAVTAAIGEAWNTFRLSLEAKGVRIQNAAQTKFARILELNRQIDSRKPETFFRIYEAVEAFNGWTDREVAKAALVTDQPREPEPTVDIETLDTSTREGQKLARKAVFEAWMRESRPLWNQFVNHMREEWGLEMNQEQQDAVGVYLYNSNQGITAKGLDKARQVVLGCLTADETLAKTIEQHSDSSVSDYSVRRDIANRIRAVQA